MIISFSAILISTFLEWRLADDLIASSLFYWITYLSTEHTYANTFKCIYWASHVDILYQHIYYWFKKLKKCVSFPQNSNLHVDTVETNYHVSLFLYFLSNSICTLDWNWFSDTNFVVVSCLFLFICIRKWTLNVMLWSSQMPANPNGYCMSPSNYG